MIRPPFRRDYLAIAPARYEFRIKGRLSPWVRSQWFKAMTVVPQGRTTLIRAEVADQAALYAMLVTLRSLSLPLLSVLCLEPDEAGG